MFQRIFCHLSAMFHSSTCTNVKMPDSHAPGFQMPEIRLAKWWMTGRGGVSWIRVLDVGNLEVIVSGSSQLLRRFSEQFFKMLCIPSLRQKVLKEGWEADYQVFKELSRDNSHSSIILRVITQEEILHVRRSLLGTEVLVNTFIYLIWHPKRAFRWWMAVEITSLRENC